MKKTLLILAASLSVSAVMADTIPVENFRYVGPFELRQPVQLDSTDVDAKKYDVKSPAGKLNLVAGANMVGFDKVAQAMIWEGIAY